jgi:peroxiredoxin
MFGRRAASIALGLCLGLALAFSNATLSQAHAQVQGPGIAPTPTPAPSPLPGDLIPEFDTTLVDGTRQHVGFAKGSNTVLLFFLSSCPHCHKMMPEWNRAYERRSPNLVVYGVILDQEPAGFFTAMPLSFPVLRSPSRAFLQSIKVYRTPTQIRVGPGGRIEDVVVGIVDPIPPLESSPDHQGPHPDPGGEGRERLVEPGEGGGPGMRQQRAFLETQAQEIGEAVQKRQPRRL